MAGTDASPTYRPFLNRNRVVYALHPDPAECERLAAAFTEQGFMSSHTQTVDGLARLIELHRPDVILVDLALVRQEADLVGALRILAFGVRIFALAETNPEAAEVVKAVRSGAVSVFVKPFQFTEIVRAVTDELRADLRIGEGANGVPNVQGLSSLTPRELEVLRRVVAGETNKEAAQGLGISPRTVEVHRAAAMHKLGARNTAEMIRLTLKA
ncbi:MAG: LuxR C-terminal-related transcriptional regulator [Devosia sp.]